MATKKQIAALNEIISNAQAIANGRASRLGSSDSHVHLHGVQKNPQGGFIVTDGFVAVLYNEDIVCLPHDEDFDAGTLIPDLFKEQVDGDYYIVQEPFDGQVKMTEIRRLLRDNSLEHNNRNVICLRTVTDENKAIQSFFDILNVRRAVEAVGGKPILYIGYGRPKSGGRIGTTYRQPIPYLLVEPEGSSFSLEDGYHAMVMPVRVSK